MKLTSVSHLSLRSGTTAGSTNLNDEMFRTYNSTTVASNAPVKK